MRKLKLKDNILDREKLDGDMSDETKVVSRTASYSFLAAEAFTAGIHGFHIDNPSCIIAKETQQLEVP